MFGIKLGRWGWRGWEGWISVLAVFCLRVIRYGSMCRIVSRFGRASGILFGVFLLVFARIFSGGRDMGVSGVYECVTIIMYDLLLTIF